MAALLKSAGSQDPVGSNPTLSASIRSPEAHPPLAGPPPGLCGACRHARVISTQRGSRFWLCGRSTTDARFPRYPALPVRACTGFEPGDILVERDPPRH
jgi:hypothetical protein